MDGVSEAPEEAEAPLSFAFVCSVCLFVRDAREDIAAAVTVINGHAVCEDHATDAQESLEHGRIIGSIRRRQRSPQL